MECGSGGELDELRASPDPPKEGVSGTGLVNFVGLPGRLVRVIFLVPVCCTKCRKSKLSCN